MSLQGPLCCLVVAVLSVAPATASAAESAEAARRREAFELSYNLDRQQALSMLRQAAVARPDDPAAHRAVASVLWFTILFARGAVTSDHYLGSFSRTQVELSKPPADLDAEFRAHVERAIALAEARVRAAPRDAGARYDLGAALGLRASYIATVEGKLFAGFKAARRAYDEHEAALTIDPGMRDAGLIVGMYRYVVSTLSLPLRMMAYVAGFGGGRERGIEIMEDTARHGGESRTDAMFALVLVHNRERRYDDALRILSDLRARYPRNRLVLLEAGSTALRAKRYQQAVGLLTEGLAMVGRETRPLIPGERALWQYKRGTAHAGLGQIEAARADLAAATSPGAQAWVAGRAHAELARIALRTRDHGTARTHAARSESLCREGSDPRCVDDARQLMRSARGR